MQWLRDEIKLIHSAEDTEYYASKVQDTNGVYFVPAFVGLSAPYWDQYARGAILGLTRGANRNHIIRACLESIAYQIRDVIECMEKDSGIRNTELKVDGGACKNNFLMQFQADLLGVPVLRPKIVETTARGAAFLAGLATGFWRDQDELVDTFELDRRFEPTIDQAQRTSCTPAGKRLSSGQGTGKSIDIVAKRLRRPSADLRSLEFETISTAGKENIVHARFLPGSHPQVASSAFDTGS